MSGQVNLFVGGLNKNTSAERLGKVLENVGSMFIFSLF
jgi:hypothetical protein